MNTNVNLPPFGFSIAAPEQVMPRIISPQVINDGRLTATLTSGRKVSYIGLDVKYDATYGNRTTLYRSAAIAIPPPPKESSI